MLGLESRLGSIVLLFQVGMPSLPSVFPYCIRGELIPCTDLSNRSTHCPQSCSVRIAYCNLKETLNNFLLCSSLFQFPIFWFLLFFTLSFPLLFVPLLFSVFLSQLPLCNCSFPLLSSDIFQLLLTSFPSQSLSCFSLSFPWLISTLLELLKEIVSRNRASKNKQQVQA